MESTHNVRCISCYIKERLLDFADLKVADHICMSGLHSVINIFGKQLSAYTHHAIVKKIVTICPSSAMLTMIHFYTRPFNTTIEIRETSNLFHLRLDEIHIIRYRHQTNHADVVLKKAETLKKHSSHIPYSILHFNCESLCNWCCIGNADSLQAESVKDFMRDLLILNDPEMIGVEIVEEFVRYCNISLDDLLQLGSSTSIIARKIWPILYTRLVIYRNVERDNSKKYGNICSLCRCHKVNSIGIDLGVIYGGYLPLSIKGPCERLPFLRLTKFIMKWFFSPFHGQKVNQVHNYNNIEIPECAQSWLQYIEELDPRNTNAFLKFQTCDVDHTRSRKHSSISDGKIRACIPNDVKEGLIVQYGNWLYRTAICTKVEVEVDANCPSRHYTWITVVHCGDFWNRTVQEERLKFDLNVDLVYVYMHHPIYRYKTSAIITRAQAMVGNKRGWTSSLEFARKIVVEGNDQMVSKIDQLYQGDVIKYSSYCLFTHEALVTEVDKEANELKIVHYTSDSIKDTPTVKEENFDLEKLPIYKKSYNGYVTYPADIVVNRARSRVDERRYSIMNGNMSSDLVHWAKVVQNPAIVTLETSASHHSKDTSDGKSKFLLIPKAGQQYEKFQRFGAYVWSDLYPGVIVEYNSYYIWYKSGILSHKDENTNTIKVITYCIDKSFDTRTIKEYSKEIDLRNKDIWIYKSHSLDCYQPEDVLQNARRRLGEQTWIFGKTSWDFCKDCVLRKRSNDV